MKHTLLGPSHLGRVRLLGAVLSVGALLALCLAGCGSSTSHAGVSPPEPRTTASATWDTPTGSATSTPATTPTPVITPAPTTGWAVYHDPRFGFQVPLPPGWQPASLTWPAQPDPSGFTYYNVQFFAPGPHGEPGPGASSMAPELIQITITLSRPSPSSSLAQDQHFSPEPGTVALGTTQVKLYDRGSPGYGSQILRAVETTVGGHPMLFGMQYLAEQAWDPAVAQRDIALYLAMGRGFQVPAS
ncbi:MAG: hypothetical protein ACRDHE_14685 [Ktedonobacterales bacterium]